jgi:dipeptidyl aminopeptidase
MERLRRRWRILRGSRKVSCAGINILGQSTDTDNLSAPAGDGIYSTRNSDGDIILRSAIANSTERILVTASDIKDPNTFDTPLPFIDWRLSPDTEYLLLKTSYRKLWRHSSYGNYYLHRLSDHSTFPLRMPENPSMIAYAEWSPKGHHIAYVYMNDLYIAPSSSIDLTSNGPMSPSSIRVTHDGSNDVFNGVPDWVYEEEVFQANFALWWNPRGDRIAFLRSDEADVRDYTLQYYNPSGEAMEPEPYPQNFVMK